MKIGKARFKDLCGPWEDEDWRFKRPHKTLQKEEFCSQVPRHLTLKKTPRQVEKHRAWRRSTEAPDAWKWARRMNKSTTHMKQAYDALMGRLAHGFHSHMSIGAWPMRMVPCGKSFFLW